MAAGRGGQAGALEPGAKVVLRIDTKHRIPFYAIVPDGKTLAYCDRYPPGERKLVPDDLVLIDLVTGKELHRRQTDPALGGVFSADGKLLVVGSAGFSASGSASIWDVARWEPLVKLQRPEGHGVGIPLAFSPDGKLVVGRSQRKNKDTYWRHDLVLWDASTGQVRVLDDAGAKLVVGGGPGICTIVGEHQTFGFPPGGPYVGMEPLAISFPHREGGERFFVEYNAGGCVFTTLWESARGKPIRTSAYGGGWAAGTSLMQSALAGKGAPMPGSGADLFRFATTPSGHILKLPKYSPPPIIAVPYEDGSIAVAVTPTERDFGDVFPLPTITFRELCRLDDYKGAARTCRLTPDCRRLVAVGIDPLTKGTEDELTLLRVWDVSALHATAAKHLKKLSGPDLEQFWDFLFKEHPDPVTANAFEFSPAQYYLALQAMASLVAHGDEGVGWLRKQMGPPVVLEGIPRLIGDLDSPEFQTRDRASRELGRIGHVARPPLERALAKDPSVEAKRRLQDLLDRLRGTAAAYELRQMRIIDVLEHINTAAARDLLKQMADGRYDPAYADEAKEALRRMSDKP
jgi:hypothetical protein